MVATTYTISERDLLTHKIRSLLRDLGTGKTSGVAYDTAWAARLSARYPGYGFEESLEWLRRNQYEDGTWGAPLLQYHDRFISTLAAVVALREVGREPRDQRRVKRGEEALWKLVGKLGRDDADTVGFPVLSAALQHEAAHLGLDVPLPPIRFAEPYKRKVKALLSQPSRAWRASTITFSLEALRHSLTDDDDVLEANDSVSVSPSATAGFLLHYHNPRALGYLQVLLDQTSTGVLPALAPIDVFEIAWSLSHFIRVQAVEPDDPDVQAALARLWQVWSPKVGVGHSSFFGVPDVDDTAAAFVALRWGGYPVNSSVFEAYEQPEHFCCYPGETNPSLSAHVRLLMALRVFDDHPNYETWIAKVLGTLQRFDENGSCWWDKWHASPYYVTGASLFALQGIADNMARSRLTWILRTQNDDGGWGYLDESTPEETAYCLEALLMWDRTVERIDARRLDAAAKYLSAHLHDAHDMPLWIGKSLYTPLVPVKAAILSALYSYVNWD